MTEAEKELEQLERVYKNLKKTIIDRKKRLGLDHRKRRKNTSSQLKITTNAIVRYLHLVQGVDIENMRKEILSLCDDKEYKSYELIKKNDLTIVVANNNVVNLFKSKNHKENNHE